MWGGARTIMFALTFNRSFDIAKVLIRDPDRMVIASVKGDVDGEF